MNESYSMPDDDNNMYKQQAVIPDTDVDQYRSLVNDHLKFIEKQCHKACATHGWNDDSRLDPDALYTETLERLSEDNFRVVREYRGKAKVTTYISTIISHIVIDTVRKHRGRDRSRERAKKMGVIGEQLHDLVFGKGYNPEEACQCLNVTFGYKVTVGQVRSMLETMQGRASHATETGTVNWGGIPLAPFVDEDGGITVPDAISDPEQGLAHRQRKERASGVLRDVLNVLSGEECLLLTLRYPLDDNKEPKDLSEIAEILNCSEKAADGRIRRILTRCKKAMLKMGIALNDLVD